MATNTKETLAYEYVIAQQRVVRSARNLVGQWKRFRSPGSERSDPLERDLERWVDGLDRAAEELKKHGE
jgi:hypothetical protein